jgi:alkylated DNA repair dioxygenase AlkB
MYENSRDSLGWHADDDPGIDHRFGIAIVTLYEYAGKDRNISFKNIATGETETIAAAYGSLIYMPPGMQSTHLHRIPKAGFECPRRISLTYRMLKED